MGAQHSFENKMKTQLFFFEKPRFLIRSMVFSVPGLAELTRFVIRCHSFCLS